ncbi:hypothetical protein L1987_04097 [Smallanthus sonchifolius]|uniref:Uncharacterized protein n=1 Tax=Smallanthus sonchifolius TaxID=185202 RepID=A0ACB9KCG8_9ASTR|nr:hypothetical protein L1987_04097 [Smallanthus sonchifolius]
MGDMNGFARDYTYHQHLQPITDHDDDSYHLESDDDNDDGDHSPRVPSQHDSAHGGGSRGTSKLPPIKRVGEKFASFEFHQSIGKILREHLKGPWITFNQVPQSARDSMFDCFRTRWSWESECEQLNYDAFKNVLKGRYRDIMYYLKAHL